MSDGVGALVSIFCDINIAWVQFCSEHLRDCLLRHTHTHTVHACIHTHSWQLKGWISEDQAQVVIISVFHIYFWGDNKSVSFSCLICHVCLSWHGSHHGTQRARLMLPRTPRCSAVIAQKWNILIVRKNKQTEEWHQTNASCENNKDKVLNKLAQIPGRLPIRSHQLKKQIYPVLLQVHRRGWLSRITGMRSKLASVIGPKEAGESLPGRPENPAGLQPAWDWVPRPCPMDAPQWHRPTEP